MARLKELAIGRGGDSYVFDPETILERHGYNVRDMESAETQAHIRKMADAIHASGTAAFPPITICQEQGGIYVVAGYCRRRAYILAKQEGAPIKGILAIANTQKEDERTLDLLNSNDGLPLTPLEKAKVVQRLISFQWTSTEIARRRGVSVTAINNLLALLEAPPGVIKLVEQGEVSATLAVTTMRKNGNLFAGDVLKDAVTAAKTAGKQKATAKHIAKAVSKEINWSILGPKLKQVLMNIVNAVGQAEQTAAIQQGADLMRKLC
jgi:ParB family chromosome partitioning protein